MFGENIENIIIYEDKEIIVCRKDAGIPVQSSRIGTWDMENGLKNYLAEKDKKQQVYIAVIHRLDQPVEGVLVFAKTPYAAKELSRQVKERKFGKGYLAVTDRKPLASGGILEDWLKKDGRTNTSCVVPQGTEGAKYARLSYEVVECKTLKDGTERYLIKINLDTGRHHQIRVQMANAGMPLVGDRKYNPGFSKEKSSLGLCAEELVFLHPKSKEKMQFHVMPSGSAFSCFADED